MIKKPVHMKMIKKKISMGMYNKDIGKLHDDFSLVSLMVSACLALSEILMLNSGLCVDLLERVRFQRARLLGVHRRQDARGLPPDALGSARHLPEPSSPRPVVSGRLVRLRRRRLDDCSRHRRVHSCHPERAGTAARTKGHAQVWRWRRRRGWTQRA
jgi:hypothetical protein